MPHNNETAEKPPPPPPRKRSRRSAKFNSLLERHGTAQYHVSLVDGGKLPSWVDVAQNRILLAKVPTEGGTLDLKISARFPDNTEITRLVTIQNQTGEIQEYKKAKTQAQMFKDQLEMEPAL